MTNAISTFSKFLLRIVIIWIIDALSLALASFVVPGMQFTGAEGATRAAVIVSAALLLAMVNLVVRPIVLLLARPFGWIVTFVIGFLVNAMALWTTAAILPGFEITILAGLFGAIVVAFFNTIFVTILELNEEGSWYQSRIEYRARKQPFAGKDDPGRALMVVEIDGLSYWHLKQALDDGLMPTLKGLIDNKGFQLSRTDCGLPSMTSACQAGIMFGDNHDIPAYRWYDKDKGKLYVSASDATELNARYAHGQGLMRGGSSIMNMFNGDAEKSMFTMANMFEADPDENRIRADDIALLMLDPSFLMRSIALFIVELVRELWEAWQQQRKDVRPRLNRLSHWYPFIRAAMCSFMRDISANIAILDMMRGAPSIYMLYLGYDEVAHHSGPWTRDAFGDLKRLDKTLARLHQVVTEKAPRPYDFVILSDHGQSFGATFLQRYGISIKELIEQLLPQGTTVAQSIGGDTGAMGLQGVAGELANAQEYDAGGKFGKTIARQGVKLAQAGADASDETIQAAEAAVTAYGSGNAAQVYFDLYPRRILLSELETAYPGTVDTLIQHEGIGVVLGYADDGTAVAIGKGGRHNLHTGEIVGEDPVAQYAPAQGEGAADVEKRIWQMRRVMDFPHAGDLWVISTVYEDGSVAALEELIGSHGGVGGEQTDAFILHPGDWDVPETRNSIDVFHILNQHRGAPVAPDAPPPPQETTADWSVRTLLAGIRRPGVWLGYAVRCIMLDPRAFQSVVDDPTMTGPALLISLVTLTLTAIARAGGFDPARILGTVLVWIALVLAVFGAGYLLTRQGNFTKTFRAYGFAQSVFVIELFAFFWPVQSMVFLIALVLNLLAVWMGAAVAAQTRGWRTLILPIAYLLVVALATGAATVLLDGAAFTFESIRRALGL